MEMSLGFSCNYSLEMRQDYSFSVPAVGGMTENLFRRSERFLLAKKVHQEALMKAALRKNVEDYQSMMDFLICELFPQWKPWCRRYYEEKGAALCQLLTGRQVAWYDRRLWLALKLCRYHHTVDRATTWKALRENMLANAA